MTADLPLSDLAGIARSINRQLRPQLADSAALEDQQLRFEEAAPWNQNPVARLRHASCWAANLLQDSPLCNSWLGYDWFNVGFGAVTPAASSTTTSTRTGTRAITSRSPCVLMRVPKEFSYRRHVLVAPRTPSQAVVRIQLPAREAARFKRAVQDLGLPLTELPDSVGGGGRWEHHQEPASAKL